MIPVCPSLGQRRRERKHDECWLCFILTVSIKIITDYNHYLRSQIPPGFSGQQWLCKMGVQCTECSSFAELLEKFIYLSVKSLLCSQYWFILKGSPSSSELANTWLNSSVTHQAFCLLVSHKTGHLSAQRCN